MLTPRSFRRIMEGQQNASPGKTRGEYGSLRGRVTDSGVSLTPPRLVATPKKSITGGSNRVRGSEERWKWGSRGILSSSKKSSGGHKPRGIWESSGSEEEEKVKEEEERGAGSLRRQQGGGGGRRRGEGEGFGLGGGESESKLKDALCGAWEENRNLRNQLREFSFNGTPAPPSSSSSSTPHAGLHESRQGPGDRHGGASSSPSLSKGGGGADPDLVAQIKELREGREQLRVVCQKQARELDRRSHRIAELSNMVSTMQRFIREKMHSAAAKRDEERWDETGTPERDDGKQNNQDGAGRSSVDGDDEHPYGLYATREVEKDDVEMMLEALLRGDSGDLKAWQADFSKASVAGSNNSQSRGHAPGLVGSMKEADVEKMQSNLEKANFGLPLPDFDTWLFERHASESPPATSGAVVRENADRRNEDATQIELDMEIAHAAG